MTRDQIDALIRDGDTAAAAGGLGRLFAASPTAGIAAFVVSRFEQLTGAVPLAPLRLAILRSFTIEPLLPILRARCYLAGIDATMRLGDFNVIDQELFDSTSPLYQFAPDVIVIAVLTRDLAPGIWAGDGSAAEELQHAARRVRDWITAGRRHTGASVIVQSFEQPAYPADGVRDVVAAGGQRRAIDRLNEALVAAAADQRGVYVLDYDALVARHGRSAWADPHKDLAMRVPLRPDSFVALADEYMRFVHPLRGKSCKVLAVDLDNTLWGGVIGEDGATGIRIGTEYPGSAYLAVQRALKALTRRGILLAVCSKNNREEALDVLRTHPEMVLRPDDFAAIRINWDDKASNLRGIARELNIGLDALAFLDDNPVERDWVRSQLPEVHVIDAADDPVSSAEALHRAPVFERLVLSEEDQSRGAQYRAQRERAHAEQAAGSVEDFLRSLDMRVVLGDVTPRTLGRAAQLTQKTNQFNVTTRRYTEEQISRFADEPGTFARIVRVTDRYGDNGMVGLLMARVSGDRCEIDTLLLSCRVIGRQVESVLLADAAAQAQCRGATRLAGWVHPTEKNAPARDVFARHGFLRTVDRADGTCWERDLASGPAAPEWIDVTQA